MARRGRVFDSRFPAVQAMPPGREVSVRSKDGVRLHVEVFGPDDAPPVVLAHGITCAIRVWAYQIAELAKDHRVIAYDHRGHGRSGVPRARHRYSLAHLAGDLDSVLEATLAPGEKALIAGHSMGGIAISSWAEWYPHRVPERAAAVALVNTTTGDLLRGVQLLTVPEQFAAARARAAAQALRAFGGIPLFPGLDRANARLVSMMAVGPDADPAIARFVFELFCQTPPAGRGGWARALVDSIGERYIGVQNLTVPALVIGARQDRILPLPSSQRIAEHAPNLADFVQMPGGHCSILEYPDEVNRHLRALSKTVFC
ncbi:alpha/beta hydrolase [uncultured Mycolicibacterium sp.]|uniref:alpha/beta fold hydrolase n=1 Tax=uncultured Mycolicibacterium sp. TaxID=2320817 RepID=UPI00260F23D6|nr:alpha/beta hydrolase [uncultured Mycolicibacterium sp.]